MSLIQIRIIKIIPTWTWSKLKLIGSIWIYSFETSLLNLSLRFEFVNMCALYTNGCVTLYICTLSLIASHYSITGRIKARYILINASLFNLIYSRMCVKYYKFGMLNDRRYWIMDYPSFVKHACKQESETKCQIKCLKMFPINLICVD